MAKQATPHVYEFDVNGTTYTIPAFDQLPMGALRKARKSTDEMDMAFTILESVMGEDSPELAAVDSMNSAAFQEWLQGWTQGAGVGEASSSES